MKLVTAEEMRGLERAANDAGLTYATMMERAGNATAQAIRDRISVASARATILVGPGNNGGDGLVAARYLHEWGHQVTVYIWKRTTENDANLRLAQEREIPILWASEDQEFQRLASLVGECDVLVDALLGTGVTGALRGGLPELLHQVRQILDARATQPREGATPLRAIGGAHVQTPRGSRPLVVAVDLPSGLNSDTGEIDERALAADLTVTFACPKRGQFLFPGASKVGELTVADIGIQSGLGEGLALEVATPECVASMLPRRPLDAHKGTFGKALVVAGSTNYVGAPCLAAEAACRSGAGLVTLAVAEAIYPIVAAKLTEPTFLVLPDDMGVLVPAALRVLARRLGHCDALLVGPGLGTEPATKDFVWQLVSGGKHSQRRAIGFDVAPRESQDQFDLPPLVLDADGLNLLAGCERWWRHLPPETVLTPHPGEMARLLGCDIGDIQADRIGAARNAADKWGRTVVLKGAYTVVASGGELTTMIPFANPALATAGTGDVLAGAIVGLIAQGLSSFEAAVCGAYLHGMAGELARQKLGPAGVLASDLLPLMPLAMKHLRKTERSETGNSTRERLSRSRNQAV